MFEFEMRMDIEPVPKQRPRCAKFGGVFTPKKTADFEKAVAKSARECMGSRLPTSEAISLRVEFLLKTPKSKNGKALKKAELVEYAAGNVPHDSKPDLDNLLKSVLDALNEIVYYDDSQVISFDKCLKRYAKTGEVPGFKISLRTVND